MEGTSGAADPGLLRGSTGDAALGGIAGEVGVSLRLRGDATTGGVRADRVGAKLLRAHAFGRPQREMSIAEAIGPWPVKPRLALAAHSPMATLGVARSLAMLMRERSVAIRGRARGDALIRGSASFQA